MVTPIIQPSADVNKNIQLQPGDSCLPEKYMLMGTIPVYRDDPGAYAIQQKYGRDYFNSDYISCITSVKSEKGHIELVFADSRDFICLGNYIVAGKTVPCITDEELQRLWDFSQLAKQQAVSVNVVCAINVSKGRDERGKYKAKPSSKHCLGLVVVQNPTGLNVTPMNFWTPKG